VAVTDAPTKLLTGDSAWTGTENAADVVAKECLFGAARFPLCGACRSKHHEYNNIHNLMIIYRCMEEYSLLNAFMTEM
jgi:hypothetical protein